MRPLVGMISAPGLPWIPASRFQILVGITGKRNFDDGGISVRAALRDCFALLDERFGDSPKTLITGLAIGADTIAADVALDRGWAVVGVLPFQLDEYLKSYSDDEATKLRQLLARDKVTTIVLDPLRDPATGAPSTIAALQGSSNPLRSALRAGRLLIAERSALLIAVMPADEAPTRIGGTSRVVHFRLAGAFEDADAKLTMEASTHLRPVLIFDEPLSGPVWLIDPQSAASRRGPARRDRFVLAQMSKISTRTLHQQARQIFLVAFQAGKPVPVANPDVEIPALSEGMARHRACI